MAGIAAGGGGWEAPTSASAEGPVVVFFSRFPIVRGLDGRLSWEPKKRVEVEMEVYDEKSDFEFSQ